MGKAQPTGPLARKRKARPSPEERRTKRIAKDFLGKVDKKYRTRQGKRTERSLQSLEAGHPGILETMLSEIARNRPPKFLNEPRSNIFSGTRMSFERYFSQQWWGSQLKPWICAVCGKPIDPAGKGAAAPSIDHKEPWSRLQTGIPTIDVCCQGAHWTIALTEEVRAVYQDARNLRPTHQGCNSSKGGVKGLDSLAPQRAGACPGSSICTQPKAS